MKPDFFELTPSARNSWQQLLDVIQHKSLEPHEIAGLQQTTYRHLLDNSTHISQPNFSVLSNQDLGTLFHFVDESFFDGTVGRLCEQVSSQPLRFRLSTRMTSTGGSTKMWRNTTDGTRAFEISIATTPLFETFKIENQAIVGGLTCRNRIEGLQRIMEHEIIHLIEMLLWEDSCCAAARFKNLVRRFFGHLESNHRMLTPREVARKIKGIQPGDWVGFSNQGKRFEGKVNRISKRATVLIPSSQGNFFSDGNRYLKYYVPLHRLSLVKPNKEIGPG